MVPDWEITVKGIAFCSSYDYVILYDFFLSKRPNFSRSHGDLGNNHF